MDRGVKIRQAIVVVYCIATLAAMVLASRGIIARWIYLTMLIVLHVWIFTRIGIRIYRWRKARRDS